MKLFAKGCLGTCWYGRYHYIEPWVGCGHNCHYCYARVRNDVRTSLERLNSTFDRPVLTMDEEELVERIVREANKTNVNIVKLSRYTDIFTPNFLKGGTSYRVLSALCASKVDRIIITTKGVPDASIIDLMNRNRNRFSYNVAAKPEVGPELEPGALSVEERLSAAAAINRMGILTTVHMDPMIAGLNDSEEELIKFFELLKGFKLNRVMFSYLLLSTDIVGYMSKKLAPEDMSLMMEHFDHRSERQYLPKQGDTKYISLKENAKKASVERISGLLKKMGFEYALCSLKNGKCSPGRHKNVNLCDGTFYA